MINRVVLVGRLTKDPELRYTPNGLAVVRFTIAINRQFSNQQGEKEADFVNCIAWRKQAENLSNFQRKGNLIGVDGRIQTGSYEGQDGKRVYTTEVVADSIQFLEPRSQGGGEPHNTPNHQPNTNYPPPPSTNINSYGSHGPIEPQNGPNQFGQQTNNFVQEDPQQQQDPFATGKNQFDPTFNPDDDLPF